MFSIVLKVHLIDFEYFTSHKWNSLKFGQLDFNAQYVRLDVTYGRPILLMRNYWIWRCLISFARWCDCRAPYA